MRIAHLSDVHVGDGRYDAWLLDAAVDEINAEAPDLVAAEIERLCALAEKP